MIKGFRCYQFHGKLDMGIYTHNSLELNYAETDAVIYEINGQEVLLKKNSLCIIDASCPHRLKICDERARVISMEIDCCLLKRIYPRPILDDGTAFSVIKCEAFAGEIVKNLMLCSEMDEFLKYGIAFLIEMAKKSDRAAIPMPPSTIY